MIDLATPRRQSPIAVVFLAVRAIRQIGIAQAAIIVAFVATGSRSAILLPAAILGAIALAAFSIAAWWRFTFQVAGSELIVHRGVFRSERLAVPIDRIQSVAIDQELLHRMVDVVKVSVDTAGSSDAELALDAVGRPVAQELERLTVAARASPRPAAGEPLPPPTVERVVVAHGRHRLMAVALASSPLRGIAVLAPLVALWGAANDLGADRTVEIDGADARWWWAPVGIVAFLALSVVLNLVRILLRDWDLTVSATPTGLRRTAGLLSRTSTATSTDRVQIVTSRGNPAERRIGIRTVRLATIGPGDIAVPGADDGQFDTLRALSDVSLDAPLDRRTHRAAVWLAVRNTTIAVAAAAFAAWFVVGWWSLSLLALVPIVLATSAQHVRTYRWSVTGQLATSVRVIDASTEQALLRKTNGVTVSQSLFERRRGLAHVSVQTAAGTIRIGMIPIDEARAVRDIAVHAAQTDRRPWM